MAWSVLRLLVIGRGGVGRRRARRHGQPGVADVAHSCEELGMLSPVECAVKRSGIGEGSGLS
ncbi:hypothetical protein ACFXKC_55980 [Streptomyces sp. NPDC059340]|uniref:hypothetical protein n=1 Tax=Streptomyces sp. NPDC059340 TaxID=3346806 RepID=UPI0036C0FB77